MAKQANGNPTEMEHRKFCRNSEVFGTYEQLEAAKHGAVVIVSLVTNLLYALQDVCTGKKLCRISLRCSLRTRVPDIPTQLGGQPFDLLTPMCQLTSCACESFLNVAVIMIDLQDELAIFQLLAEDFRAISGEAQPNDISTTGTHSPNGDIAVNLIATDAQIARDQAYAELLQSQEASLAVSRQYAHSLAAEEQKSRLDREFARTLQEGDEDDTSTCDADR